MSGSAKESTDSSQSVSKPLTAAERQDLYRSSIGNILNTYNQSGLPYGGFGSQTNATNATFDPNATSYNKPGSTWAPAGTIYNADGTAAPSRSASAMEGKRAPLDFFNQTSGAPDPTVNMPTGAADPGGINMPVYQTPQYQSGGAFQAGGYTAGLDYAKSKDMEALNNNLAKRGIWSSGLAEKAGIDTNSAYAGAYEKAGADQATAQNAYNTTAAQNANNFNVTNANNAYQAGWKPLEYLQGIWNNTGGQTTGSSSFGQSLSVSAGVGGGGGV